MNQPMPDVLITVQVSFLKIVQLLGIPLSEDAHEAGQ